MYYYTSEQVAFGFLNKDNYAVGKGSYQEIIQDRARFNDFLSLCNYCLEEKDENNINIDSFYYLIENNFLCKNKIDYNDLYSKNHLYYQCIGYDPKLIQNVIDNQNVLVVGGGGIGNIVSYFLCSIGVKRITIIDDDIIERSNLNRQFLFRNFDIGKCKVDILKRELKELRNTIDIDVIRSKLLKEVLSRILLPTLVISSADDEYCIEMINEFCCTNKIPLVNAGYLNDISVIGPFHIPYNSSCLCCDNSIYLKTGINDKLVTKINSRMKAPSMLTNNFFTGGLLSSELLKFFAGDYNSILSRNHIIGLYNKDFRFERIEVKKNNHCLYCGKENADL